MRTTLFTLCFWILASTVGAAQLHVRDNDAGLLHEVGDVPCEFQLTFSETEWNADRNFTQEFMGFTWGPKMAGMTEDCPGSTGAVRGSFPGGVTLPSTPLTIVSRGHDPHGLRKKGQSTSYIVGADPQMLSGVRGCSSPGKGPLAMVFDKPRTALCMDYVFFKDAAKSCTPGERWHQEFWAADGSHIGHQDAIPGGMPMTDSHPRWCLQSFCWESDVPVAAITTWPENGPGAMWNGVCVGSAADPPDPPAPPDPNSIEECIARCLKMCGP